MKDCPICRDNRVLIDWKNEKLLLSFMDEFSRIKPGFKTGLCAKHQRRVAKAIRRSRVAGIIPFTSH